MQTTATSASVVFTVDRWLREESSCGQTNKYFTAMMMQLLITLSLIVLIVDQFKCNL